MPEAKEDKENKKEKPARVIEEGDEGHDDDGNKEDDPAPSAKESIGNVASIELSDRQKVEGSHEKPNPSRISDGMKKDIMIFCNLPHD